MTKKPQEDEPTFADQFIYQCSVCGAWIPDEIHEETYDKEKDTVICPECSTELKVGSGIRGTDEETEGDLDGKLFFICPECNSSINEDYIIRVVLRGEDFFQSPCCEFTGKHEGGLE